MLHPIRRVVRLLSRVRAFLQVVSRPDRDTLARLREDDAPSGAPPIGALLELPAGSLGYACAVHLEQWGPPPSGADLVLHALLDVDGTDAGTLGVTGFRLAQRLHHPDSTSLAAASADALVSAALVLHAALYNRAQLRPFLDDLLEGYLRGRVSRPVFAEPVDPWLDRPVHDVRTALAIPAREAARRALAA